MMNGVRALLLGMGVLMAASLLSGAASAQQFSADLVSLDPRGVPVGAPGKVYVAHSKVRIETPEIPTGFFILDSDRGVAYFVRPAQRQFMDAKRSSRLTQLFVPVDPAAPCPRWRAAAALAGDDVGWNCLALATADDERLLARFEVTAAGQRDERWVDGALRFPVKVEGEDGGVTELRRIERGPQPPQLFEIPDGYGRFDPEALIKALKGSDVWVDPPKD